MRALLFITLIVVFGLPPSVSAQETVSVSAEELYAGGPSAPQINSITHPDPDRWYRSADATFYWNLPAGVTAVAAELHTVSGREPMRSYRPPVEELTIEAEDQNEGVNYLSVQFRNDIKWGMYAERTLKIDDTPPEPFVVTIDSVEENNGRIAISFEARDMLSGIAYYDLYINGRHIEKMLPADARRGYLFDYKVEGMQKIKVVAYDHAGNDTQTELSVFPTVALSASAGVGAVAKDPASVLVGIMAAIMLMMFGYLIYERLRYDKRVKSLRKETTEVHNQMIRIFTALREEIYDQIRQIDSKPRLSKREKEAVDGLNKAMTVSERLIEKEVNDVKKLLSD